MDKERLLEIAWNEYGIFWGDKMEDYIEEWYDYFEECLEGETFKNESEARMMFSRLAARDWDYYKRGE